MTIATDRGFKIGALYRVINDDNSSYYKKDMVVTFTNDDGSICPRFKRISGEPNKATSSGYYYIDLMHLEPTESVNACSNKLLLLLYINQQYPDDKVLKALVSAL